MKLILFRGHWREVTSDGFLGRFGAPPAAADEQTDNEVVRAALAVGDKCPCCGAVLTQVDKCSRCEEDLYRVAGSTDIVTGEVVPKVRPAPLGDRYKVITQRDEFFKGKFNPEALSQLLNVYAAQGWRVVSATATDVGSFWGSFWNKGGGSSRQELVIIMEKQESL